MKLIFLPEMQRMDFFYRDCLISHGTILKQLCVLKEQDTAYSEHFDDDTSCSYFYLNNEPSIFQMILSELNLHEVNLNYNWTKAFSCNYCIILLLH